MSFSLTCWLCFVLKEQLTHETQPPLAVLEREAIKAPFFLFYSRKTSPWKMEDSA